VIAATLCNVVWTLFRYRLVSTWLASLGAIVVLPKWLLCIGVAVYLFLQREYGNAVVSATWPLLIFPIGLVPPLPVEIGRLQKMFMAKLGYEYRNPFEETL
jgi:hypothetical protein